MEQDVAVQYIVRSLILFAGVLVSLGMSTWFVGWVCRRSRMPTGVTALAQVLTPVALLYGASLYLDMAGHVVQARVESTEERIAHHTSGRSIPGNWSRSFWASVTFDTPEGRRMAPLWLDEAAYDALLPAQAIGVRYLPWLPFIARPADQSTLSFVPWRWLVGGIVILGVVVVLRPAARFASRKLPAAVTAFAILAAIGIAIVWVVFPMPWAAPLDPPILTTEAEVVRVREETRSFTSGGSSVPAPQPWNIVELRFVPQGRRKPVIAVDSVDVGSVAGLRVGARLAVSYSSVNPREARLNGARTWRWREWLELAQFAFWGAIVIGGFLLLGKVLRAGFRRVVRPS